MTTVISRLAERQLAFERQQAPLKVIQADYWNVAIAPSTSALAVDNVDRLGLTGSARLLKDVYQLDNYAFDTRKRKQALTMTLDLAAMFPLEFQRFRETGVLIFQNPDQTETPMAVRFNTRRSDFPPNMSNLAIQHVVLYLVRKDGEVFEQPIRHLHFTAEGMSGPVGGPTSTVSGRVSTRSGNGTNWLPFIGQPPYGEWELAFSDNPPGDAEARNRFANESIENMPIGDFRFRPDPGIPVLSNRVDNKRGASPVRRRFLRNRSGLFHQIRRKLECAHPLQALREPMCSSANGRCTVRS